MSEVKLNRMQKVAVDMGKEWFFSKNKERGWFEISGAAGTGKTTVVRELIRNLGLSLDNFLFIAYVGKATIALRLNDIPAKTIHSGIYDVVVKYKKDENGNTIYSGGKPVFVKTFQLKDGLGPNIKGIILDEGGMVNEQLANDVLSFGLPTFVLGDTNQLPPVIGKPFFLQKPDVTLNEIMRQAKDSQILYLAKLATWGVPIPYGSYGVDDECVVIPRSQLTDDHLRRSDIVICETNATRDKINNYIRKNIMGIDNKNIVVGDKLICRTNEWDTTLEEDPNIALVNGLIGYAQNIHLDVISKAPLEMDFRPEFMKTESFKHVPVDPSYVFSPYEIRKKVNSAYSTALSFEFGYCITCHLSQGSQYGTVLVYCESFKDSLYKRQWLYTAITRARFKLIIVS